MRNRKAYNKEIMKLLTKLVNQNPDMRFTQMLVNADVLIQQFDEHGLVNGYKNEYALESSALFERMKKATIFKLS